MILAEMCLSDRMKSLNAKRIAAVAASLVMGLAVAGQGVTFGNIPIVNNAGQPVVQIVVGHAAAPSDGVVAANIAAVIGNLALTTQNVTATVNTNTSAVKCVVTSPKCTLSNQQVWLGESGLAAPAGSYSFSALIGSVINRAIQLSSLSNTKTPQGPGQYTYPENNKMSQSPPASPYYAAGYVPPASVQASYNGGGVNFNSFYTTVSGINYDNILQVSNAQLPSLLSGYGGNQESEYLWVAGFPVFNQQPSVNNFQLIGAQGAYQVVFNKPIQNRTSTNGININVPIKLLGQNWTIVNATGTSSATNQQVTAGGQLWLASSLTPLTTVYVGHNVSNSSVEGFNVQLTDLGQPNQNGVVTAGIQVYYNGKPVNTTQINAFSTGKFNVSGHLLYVHVNQTFAGLYAYQKWAKIQLYANQFLVQNNKVFNQTGDGGWITSLLWTNTSSAGGKGDALQSIIIYNNSGTTNLNPGQSLNFIPNPSTYKFTFVGDNLGNNYDPVVAQTEYQPSLTYQNHGTSGGGLTISNITEPAQELVVSSAIPGAFTSVGPSSSQVTYDLTPYVLNEAANAATTGYSGNYADMVSLSFVSNGIGSTWITPTYKVQAKIIGYGAGSSNTAYAPQIVSFSSNTPSVTANQVLTTPLYNVTGIQLLSTLPAGQLTITVFNSLQQAAANNVDNGIFAQLVSASGPTLIYPGTSQYNYTALVNGNSVNYNQQNGQGQTTFTLTSTPNGPVPGGAAGGPGQYFTYQMNEIAVPTNTNAQDALAFGIYNTTLLAPGQQGTLYNINYSVAGNHKNVTYYSSTGVTVNSIGQGFRTERGSKVAQISATQDTFDLAKAVDQLQFVVGPGSAASNSISQVTDYGPYSVGQQTNLPNVTIAKVNASCSFTTTNCSISGVSNLTATPSVKQAVVSSHLNTATTPLAVLDSNANNASTLIVVGSAYVNSVAQQIFSGNAQFATSFDNGGASGPNAVTVQAFGNNRILVAGYTANQTVTAGNQFINDLLTQASKA